jgi:CHAT domain-containing protein
MPAMQALENSRLFFFEQMEELYWTHMGLEMSLSRLTRDPYPLWQAMQEWKAVALVEVMSRGLITSIENQDGEDLGVEDVNLPTVEASEKARELLDQFSTTEPVREDDIYAMAEIAEQHLDEGASVVFVDWVRYHDTLFVAAWNGTTSALRKRVVEYDYWKIEEWVKDNLGVEGLQQGQVVRKKLMRTRTLDQLRPILEPIEGFVNPNDLVVFCPAGILHAIPLHAIPFGPEGKPLIITNPVIYSASSTLLWKCVSKAAEFSATNRDDIKAIAFARLGPEDPREEERIKQVTTSTMQYFANRKVTAGRDVTRTKFMELAKGANILHYHGHAYLEAAERKNRALVVETEKSLSTSDNGHLTTMDIFDLGLDSALVVLLACASGEEDIAPNDDPLGMLSAFLYAGATSCIATLWPTQTSDARAFATRFYAHAFGGHDTASQSDSSVFLAKALQNTVQELWEDWDEDGPYHWAQFELRKYSANPEPG